MLITKKVVCGLVALCAVVAMSGCHPTVQPVSNMDKELSCSALSTEIKDAENIKNKIASKRGFSGRNVGLALVFWPGVVINEVTGNTAEADANARLVALKNIYYDKKCSVELAKADTAKKSNKG